MKKFKLVMMLAAVLSMVMMTGCQQTKGGSDQGGSEKTTAAAESKKEAPESDTTITVALMSNDWLDAAEQIASDFTQKYGIKVEYTPMPGEVEEYLQPKAAAGTLPDVMSINAGSFGADLAENGLIIDLAEIDAAKNMVESLKPVFTSESGKLFGVAGGLSSTLIYYNKNIFEDAGITKEPENWNEFLQV